MELIFQLGEGGNAKKGSKIHISKIRKFKNFKKYKKGRQRASEGRRLPILNRERELLEMTFEEKPEGKQENLKKEYLGQLVQRP